MTINNNPSLDYYKIARVFLCTVLRNHTSLILLILLNINATKYINSNEMPVYLSAKLGKGKD